MPLKRSTTRCSRAARELAHLLSSVRNLEEKLSDMTPLARGSAEVEIFRMNARMTRVARSL